MLVLRVRNKQVIEFVGKPLHLAWYFGVINTVLVFFYICICVGGRKHNMFFKTQVTVQL